MYTQFIVGFAGAILALIGSFFIAIAQAFEKIENIAQRSIVYPGYNGKAIESIVEQKIKSAYGLTIVVLGSVLQIISSVFPQYKIPCNSYYIYLIVLVVILLPIIFYFFYVKRKIKITNQLAAQIANEKCNTI